MGVVVGKMHAISKNEVDIKWTIENFLFYLMSEFHHHDSPTFFFEGQFWQLQLQPSNVDGDNKYIDLYLVKFSSGTPIKIDFSIALEIADGKKYQEKHRTKVFEHGAYKSRMISRFISRSELSKRQGELAPCGRLTVVCTLKSHKTTEMESGDKVTEKCSYCSKIVHAENISSHEKTCKYRDIKCPGCSKVVRLENWCDHECEKPNAEGDDKVTEKCSYCSKIVHAENISSHEKTCKYRDIKCPGCSKVVFIENWCDHECERPNAEDHKPPEKQFVSIAKAIIITAILTACVCVCAKNLLPSTNPCAEGMNELQSAEGDQTGVSEVNESKVFLYNQPDAAGTKKSEEVIELQTAEINKEDQSEVAAVTESKVFNSNRAGARKTRESEGVNELQSAEDNQSEVAEVNESNVSSYNHTDTLKTNKSEGLNELQSAEGDQTEVAEVNESKVSSYNQTDAAGTNKSEPFPQPVLIVTAIGSTYIEVLWVLPEDSKTNTARYSAYFRKSEANWQEISFPDASQTSCNLTNLEACVLYHIYVTSVGPTGISKPSEVAIVRTSCESIYHDQSKGRGKQSLAISAVIIIIVIVAAYVYAYSEAPLQPTQLYEEETKEKTSAEENDIEDDESEVVGSNESKASCSNKTGYTEIEEWDPQYNQSDDHGFVTDINHLLNEKRGIDVTFVIETPNGKTEIFAHQLILSMMSSYFADKFYDKQRNKGHQIIPLTGINPKTFEEMIRYCYGYKPHLKTTEEVFALFKVASQFKMISLVNLCCMFFRHTKIETGNVFSVLEISEEMEDKILKNMCYKILEEKTKEILASYELCDVSPAMVHVILDLTKLSLNSEYELIKWLFDWAKVKSEENKLNSKSTRCYLEKLLRDMNFLSLTVEEFAMLCKENPDFFSPDEMTSVFLNIGIPGTREMPDWYDKDTKFRKYTGLKK